jgi:hypothetical protein
MEPLQLVFQLTDGQETYIYEDIESALEHIHQNVLDNVSPGDEYHLEVTAMTAAQIAALPVC